MPVTDHATEAHTVGARIFELWSRMWNGEVALVDQIMAPRFRLRYAQPTPGTDAFDRIRQRPQLAEMITRFHQDRPGLRFAPDGEAVTELDLVDGLATGKVASPYLAHLIDETGHRLHISGIDMLRLDDGLITEVWSVSGGKEGRAFYQEREQPSRQCDEP
jgi:SnoaL-like domain